jgi:hypothetical protein
LAVNVTVFCSASDVGPAYTAAARKFATRIAQGFRGCVSWRRGTCPPGAKERKYGKAAP